jgi:hypothetical protein
MLKGRATFFERVRHLCVEYTRNRKQESARRFKLSLLVSWLIIQGSIGAFLSVLSACKTTRERSSRERERDPHARRTQLFCFRRNFSSCSTRNIWTVCFSYGVFASAHPFLCPEECRNHLKWRSDDTFYLLWCFFVRLW